MRRSATSSLRLRASCVRSARSSARKRRSGERALRCPSRRTDRASSRSITDTPPMSDHGGAPATGAAPGVVGVARPHAADRVWALRAQQAAKRSRDPGRGPSYAGGVSCRAATGGVARACGSPRCGGSPAPPEGIWRQQMLPIHHHTMPGKGSSPVYRPGRYQGEGQPPKPATAQACRAAFASFTMAPARLRPTSASSSSSPRGASLG